MASQKEIDSGITQDFLLRRFSYDPDSGDFLWKDPPPHNNVKVGDKAGRLHGTGYRRINIGGVQYTVHRLIWLMQTGSWPENDVDHIDRNRSNNRWDNLRDVPRRVNAYNRTKGRACTTDVVGVCRSSGGKWMAYFSREKNKSTIKYFEDFESAFAWRSAEERLFKAQLAHERAAA